MRLRLLAGSIGLLMWANMAAAAPFAYIANSGDNSVSVVDVGAGTVTDRIALDALSFPYGVAINGSGTLVYVSCQVKKSVEVIDAASKTVLAGVMPAITYVPSGLAVNAAETRLYVADQTNGKVHVYDLTASPYTEVGTGIAVGGGTGSLPEGLALNAAGTKLYVANSGSASVSVITTATNTNDNTDIALAGYEPKGLSVSPDGTRVYVSSTTGTNVALITLPSTVTAIAVGTTTNNIAMVPTGTPTSVYTNLLGTDKLGAIGYASNTLASQPVTNGNSPWGVSINDLGTKLVVTNNTSDNISIFNPASLATAPTVVALPSGARPTTLGKFIGPEMVVINATAGTGGTISPSGNVNVAVGKSKAFTITPAATHRILSVTVDSGLQAPVPSSYTFSNVVAGHTIAAAFQPIYSITVVPDQGSTGSGTYTWSSDLPTSSTCAGGVACKTFDAGANVSITATANPGSTFVGWNASFCTSITGASNEICHVDPLNANATVLPTFSGQSSTDVRVVDMNGSNPVYFNTISSGCVTANGKKVQMTVNAVSESLLMNYNAVVTLQGGFADNTFTTVSDMTTVGTLTIANGTVTLDRIRIH